MRVLAELMETETRMKKMGVRNTIVFQEVQESMKQMKHLKTINMIDIIRMLMNLVSS